MASLDLEDDSSPTPAPHDPAALTSAHRLFLTSLSHSLLIASHAFTSALHGLLRNIDALYSLILRLQTLQENLDLERENVEAKAAPRPRVAPIIRTVFGILLVDEMNL